MTSAFSCFGALGIHIILQIATKLMCPVSCVTNSRGHPGSSARLCDGHPASSARLVSCQLCDVLARTSRLQRSTLCPVNCATYSRGHPASSARLSGRVRCGRTVLAQPGHGGLRLKRRQSISVLIARIRVGVFNYGVTSVGVSDSAPPKSPCETPSVTKP